jgi:hypothetical protein
MGGGALSIEANSKITDHFYNRVPLTKTTVKTLCENTNTRGLYYKSFIIVIYDHNV